MSDVASDLTRGRQMWRWCIYCATLYWVDFSGHDCHDLQQRPNLDNPLSEPN